MTGNPAPPLISGVELDNILGLIQDNWGDNGYGSGNTPVFDDQFTDHNSDGTCPVGMTCVPADGTNDMFVIGTDGNLYFSQTGLDRYNNGADVEWWGVVADLAIIVGGAAAGVGAGVVAIISGLLGIAGATLAELIDLSNERSNDD